MRCWFYLSFRYSSIPHPPLSLTVIQFELEVAVLTIVVLLPLHLNVHLGHLDLSKATCNKYICHEKDNTTTYHRINPNLLVDPPCYDVQAGNAADSGAVSGDMCSSHGANCFYWTIMGGCHGWLRGTQPKPSTWRDFIGTQHTWCCNACEPLYDVFSGGWVCLLGVWLIVFVPHSEGFLKHAS